MWLCICAAWLKELKWKENLYIMNIFCFFYKRPCNVFDCVCERTYVYLHVFIFFFHWKTWVRFTHTFTKPRPAEIWKKSNRVANIFLISYQECFVSLEKRKEKEMVWKTGWWTALFSIYQTDWAFFSPWVVIIGIRFVRRLVFQSSFFRSLALLHFFSFVFSVSPFFLNPCSFTFLSFFLSSLFLENGAVSSGEDATRSPCRPEREKFDD